MSGAARTEGADAWVPRAIERAPPVAGLVAVVVGTLALVGWLAGITTLKRLDPSLASMKPNTAALLVVMGAALFFRGEHTSYRRRLLTTALGLAGAAFASATFLQYLVSRDFGIDQLVASVPQSAGDPLHPARMAPVTALDFVALGVAIALLSDDAPKDGAGVAASEWLAAATAVASLVAVLGYVYSVRSLYAVGPYAAVSIQSAVTILVLSLGVLLAKRRHATRRILTDAGPGGVVARRMVPAGLLLPTALGWVRMQGQYAGLYDTQFGVALFATSNIVCFTTIGWWTAATVSRVDKQRLFAEELAKTTVELARATEERIGFTLDAIGNGMIATDPAGAVVRMNPVAEALTGWKIDEARGKQLREVLPLIDPETHAPIPGPVERFANNASSTERWTHDALMLDRQGNTRSIVKSGARIRDGADQVRELVIVFHDVTEERRAQTELRKSQARYATLVNTGILGILTVDMRNGAVLEVNDAALAIVGYSRAELMAPGFVWFDLTSPGWREQDKRRQAELDASGATYAVEKEYRRKDGSDVLVLTAGAVVEEGGHEVIGFMLDLSERQRAERALAELQLARASEQHVKSLLEAAPDAVVIVDRAGAIASVNAQTERIFGYARGELEGQAIEMLVPRAIRAAHPQHRHDYFADPKVRPMGSGLSLHGQRKDGSEFPVEISLSPLETPDGTLVIASVRDVTERRMTETSLRLANQELEAFSYSVAHDLRAPLRGMNGFARLLVDTYDEKLDEEGKDWLREILMNAKKMGELIDALLSLSRVTRSALEPVAVDLSQLARSILADLAASDDGREVEVVVQDEVTGHLDPVLARALMENLLRNAWKFTGRTPHPRVEFGVREVNGTRAYFVADNGAGFDMTYAKKLFVPFQRLHSAEQFAGTGIGLATVQRIIHRHGGRVWAEGASGKGATFHFSLPGKAS